MAADESVPAETVVADLEVTVAAADAGAAVAACGRLAERTGAVVLGVVPVPEEPTEFDVRLARLEPLHPGEPVQEGMRRVNQALLDALGQDEPPEPDHPRRMCGVSFFDEDGVLLPKGAFVSTVVQMANEPDPFEGYERLEPEWPDGGPPELDARAVAELRSLVRSVTWTKIVLVAWVAGRTPDMAHAEVRALLTGVGRDVLVGPAQPDGDGLLRVWAVLGMSPDPAGELLDQAMGALTVTDWTVRGADDGTLVTAGWVAAEPPSVGVVRLELRIGVDAVLSGADGPELGDPLPSS